MPWTVVQSVISWVLQDGDKGSMGSTGMVFNGVPGAAGDKGSVGASGDKGFVGLPGAAGVSSYARACQVTNRVSLLVQS
jgi:hypothetical protein